MEESTICALSTPAGTGGIAVIRVSGPDARKLTDKIFKGSSLQKVPSHRAVHGYILDAATGEVIDEVMALPMKGPRTFTGEDTVEISCHGGMYICRRILESLLKAGCCLAEKGEFTKRAFLNGKMDLNEAEAIMDMIGARTSCSLRAALGQLEGALSGKISHIRHTLLDLLVQMEVNIDYPEYDVPEITDQQVFETLRQVKAETDGLLKSADSGQMLRLGIAAALVGSPNVGKSTILNLMLGRQRAIVTEIPGTTRDVLEEMLDLDGIPVRLMDTAGIRSTEDVVEKIGVERSLASMEACDLVLWVLDASLLKSKGSAVFPDEEEQALWKKICLRPHLLLINKKDLLQGEGKDLLSSLAASLSSLVSSRSLEDGDETAFAAPDPDEILNSMVLLSAKEEERDPQHQEGLQEISGKIREMFFSGDMLDPGKPLVTNARQKEALIRAGEALDRALQGEGMPQDLLSIDIRDAFEALGEVNGTSAGEEIVTEIFSRFCLGK
ncbi:MAG: tRNA uridine-5-carboxymethylaminomethyl(34) synthesis GTPase MnmE [Lachnospiraceae bacterium]|nr:tRNA uridine-5-carboxymethylaminomethyl(34) synthesis GTPase MnmE [Lachnospiraceae bacterium]